MGRRFLLLVLWITILLVPAEPAAGQRFHGRVIDASTEVPLPGAVVQVLDASGQPVVTLLSGTDGLFRVQGTFAGPVVVTVDMIGRARWTSRPWSLAPSDSAFLDVRMEVEPLPLEGLRAESTSRCREDRGASPVTQELWQDIKTALTAERLSRAAGRYRFRLETFERDLSPGDTLVVRDRRTVRTSRDPEGFRSAPDSVLLASGFLEDRDDGAYLFGPTSAVVLAPWFLDTHCLTVAPPDERPGLLGVRFTPNEARRVPEIAGTVWVDATTRDLRSIDYDYVSLPRHVPAGAYRGQVAFQRLDDGALFVRQWTISTPIVEVGRITVFDERREVERDAGRRESGGEILSAQVGSEILYRASRATLTGSVVDSVNLVPLAGARVIVVGTSYEASTDSLGRYLIGELPDGVYHARFTHPRLARFGFEHEPVAVTLVRGDTTMLDLFLPANARLRITAAELARLDTIASAGRHFGLNWDLRPTRTRAPAAAEDRAEPVDVFGRVVDEESGRALVDATVHLGGQTLTTDARGRFELRRLPGGRYVLRLEMLGYATRVDSLAVEEGASYDLDVRMSRQPIELEPIAVTVRSPRLEEAGYYDRLLGGLSPHVITAADIEQRGWDEMSDVFHAVPGARVLQAGFGRRIVRMLRGGPSGLGVTPNSLPGCEPALFIDGQIRRDQIPNDPNALRVLDWDVLAPLTIEAIEVYAGATTPIEYPHSCGVVLVWTRR